MALYRIIRIYEVPADNRIQATDRMMEALAHHVERQFHVMDRVRKTADPQGTVRPIDLTPPKGWFKLLIEELVSQITGRPPLLDGLWLEPKLRKSKIQHTSEAEAEKNKKR